MADPIRTETTRVEPAATERTSTTTVTTTGSGNGTAFVVGILVVIVAAIAYFMLTGGDAVVGTGSGNDVNVTVEGAQPAAPADEAPAAEEQPAAEPSASGD